MIHVHGVHEQFRLERVIDTASLVGQRPLVGLYADIKNSFSYIIDCGSSTASWGLKESSRQMIRAHMLSRLLKCPYFQGVVDIVCHISIAMIAVIGVAFHHPICIDRWILFLTRTGC